MTTRHALPALSLAAALLASACGGGSDSASAPQREQVKALAAPSQSTWSALKTLPLVPVSMSVLPDSRVMMWSAEEKFSFGAATGRTYSLLFDPATNGVTERTVTETGHNMFCPGTTNLADGRVLVNGGISSANTSIYDPSTGAWSTAAPMNIPRGYQANTLLADGAVLTLGGSWSGGVGNKHGEVWTAASGWRRLSGVPIDPFLSPDPSRNFGGDSHFMLLPAGNGKVFHAGPGINMHWIDTTGNGRVTDAGPRGDDEFSVSGTAVMFDAGKILKVGGGPGYDSVNANANSYVIDVSADVTVRKIAPMAYRRAFHNSVVLPNGQVLIVGGQTYAVGFSDNNSVLVPELFDPATETFTTLPPIAAPRNYHSVALLMPDARVVSAGGGLCGAGCAANHPDLQVLTPHYLLNADGTPATRPVINAAPATAQYGQSINVTTNGAIASFAIVRLSSTTHTVNNDQRRLPLTFRATGTNAYAVDIPTNPGLALPGNWMLFALNAAGTPSVARIVRIVRDGAATIQPLDDQSSVTGAAVSLQPTVSVPAGSTPVYSAAGLPAGLTIDAASGRIQGTPTTPGRQRVTLTLATGTVRVSTDLMWAVTAPGVTRFVKLEALSEVAGNPWSSAAEINLLGLDGQVLPRTGWTVSADSQETAGENAAASNAIDGNPSTNWHTQWQAASPPPPHSFVINLGAATDVGGLRYLPRQDTSNNGTIASYRVWLSADGVNWGSAVASGNFSDLGAVKSEKSVYFPNVARGKAATQSSTYAAATDASRAIDGNVDGVVANGSVAHTNADANAWWEVDLGTSHALSAVRLWNRSDCCADRLSNFYLLASDTPMAGRTLAQLLADAKVWRSAYPGTAPRATLVTTPGARGRYLRVQLAGTNFLQLAEVQVHGVPAVNHVPTISSPPAQSATQGLPTTLTVAAADADGDALTFTSSGLPPGLSLGAGTGIVSGTPALAGNYDVTIGVDDGHGGSAVARFAWTVLAPAPVLLPVQTQPAPSGSAVSFSAQMETPSTYSYQWDFGDGSAVTAWSSSASTTHAYASPGLYLVTVTARTADGRVTARTFWQAIQGTLGPAGRSSSAILVEPRASGAPRLWVVNPDNDSVSVLDTAMNVRLAEIGVGKHPRTLALAPDGRVWVANEAGASLSVISPVSLTVVQTVALPRASQPFGVIVGPSGEAFVTLAAGGKVLRMGSTGTVLASADVGLNVRHLALGGTGTRLLVSRFVTPPLPGEATAAVQTNVAGTPRGGEVLVLDATSLTVQRTVVLQHSEKPDTTAQGRGIPNYLGAPAIAPDGLSAWVPSKQDNVKRGPLRDGLALDFQNTLRAVTSRIDLSSQAEDLAARVDHDNSGVASAAIFHPSGAFLFVALEASRHVAVIDPVGRRELFRVDAGRAPQGLAVSADGLTLYVQNFMDRSVGVYDLTRLVKFGETAMPLAATVSTVGSEALAATVLKGKQLFYDARDPRLARDAYLSCAGCHADGAQDGRVWDLSAQGEGLRNTISLRGRAGAQGRLHWSGNFDEVQDFEAQIRSLGAGTGLMTDAQFNTGTRSQPLGDPKAGVSADLDALAAYVASLQNADDSPARTAAGALTADAAAGRDVFVAHCASCHGGTDFTDSAARVLHDIGTLKATDGLRLARVLNGIDTPTLRDAWATSPYLHDGSAPTIESAIQSHGGISLSGADLAAVAAYTRQIGREESAAPTSSANLVVRALATLADWVGALFEVRVDGAVVARGELDSTGYVDLLFDTSTFAAGAGIDIAFRNDATIGGQDRNFAVQSITLNGGTLLSSTSAGVLIDQGSGNAAYDGLNTLDAASTGGWLPWDAAIRFKAPSSLGGGTDTVTVRASTTLAAGTGAIIELRVNGELMGTRTLTSTVPADIVFATPAVPAGAKVDVVFVNDAFIGGEDRNLYVASITVRGSVIVSTAPGVTIDQGTGSTAFDGLDVVAASSTGGWVPWNAAMRFTAPGQVGANDSITVRAAATLAGGVGANMQVYHLGTLIGSAIVNSTTAQDYRFNTVTVVAGDRIDVVFTNDALIGGEDRNLVVNSVTAHGVALLPTDAAAVLDPGDGAAAFDGLDTVPGGIYGGWIPWNAALRLIAR